MKYFLYVVLLTLPFSLVGQPPNMQEINLHQGKFKTFLPNTFLTMTETMMVHSYPKDELPDIAYIDTVTQSIVSFKLMPYAANESTLNNYMQRFIQGFAQLLPNTTGIVADFVPFKNRRVGFIEMVDTSNSKKQYSFQYFTHISDSLFMANVSGPYMDHSTIKHLSKFIFQLSVFQDQPMEIVSTLSKPLICDGEVAHRTTIYQPTIPANETEEGIVMIEIKIDRAGKVTHTRWLQDDSTTDKSRLVQLSLEAARQFRYNEKADAPSEQIATLKFTFRNQQRN